MPFTRISLKRGKPVAYRKAVMAGIYEAMRETFDVPQDDRFMVLTEHDAADILYGAGYLGIERSDDLVMIQITANDTRTVEQKKALYRAIAGHLEADPGVRPEDVLVNIVEVAKENWSFGRGEAQYS